MRITLINDDNNAGVDGEFRNVDLSTLDANIHAVQWDGVKGHVEFKDQTANRTLTDFFAEFQPFFDAWVAAAPPPPTLDERKADKKGEFKNETVVRMAAQVPAWNSFERIEFLLSIANLLDSASMTAAQTLAKDILVWTKNVAIPKVNAMTTEADVLAVDPALADPFGDGTLWPT